jgi:hypothetical protein
MRPMKTNRFALFFAALAVLCTPAVLMAKRNPSDYLLRLHIYQTNWTHNAYGFHAFGRANLFDEHGVPHGVEFTYDCSDHLMASNGNEAYPAKWKKPSQSIEVIFGEIGQKPGDDYHACEFKLAMKSFAFYRHNGMIDTESPQDFTANHSNQAPLPGSTDVPVSANSRPY